MLLHEIPELRNYPYVSDFVENHLSMQFADVRSMLRLPLPEQGIIDSAGYGGCNFAVAAILCNLISGISEALFMPKNPIQKNCKGEKEWIGSGQTFKQLMMNFYPWEYGEKKRKKTDVLYYFLRNPLTHALGVERKGSYQIQVSKKSLRNVEIEEIEKSETRPDCLPLGLSRSEKNWTLDARGFYRGVFHMFRNLVKNERQMRQAEKRFSGRNFVWRYEDPVNSWNN